MFQHLNGDFKFALPRDEHVTIHIPLDSCCQKCKQRCELEDIKSCKKPKFSIKLQMDSSKIEVKQEQEESKPLKNEDKNFYRCHVCDKAYTTAGGLRNHVADHFLKIEDNQNGFKCCICEKMFDKNPSLKSHLRLHNALDCRICDASFQQRHLLNKHMVEIHSVEKVKTKRTRTTKYKKRKAVKETPIMLISKVINQI